MVLLSDMENFPIADPVDPTITSPIKDIFDALSAEGRVRAFSDEEVAEIVEKINAKMKIFEEDMKRKEIEAYYKDTGDVLLTE